MILCFAIYGEHITQPRPTTSEEVFDFFCERGVDPDRLAEELRDFRQRVPYFENLLGSGMISGQGVKVTPVDRVTRQPIGPTTAGPGVYHESTYQSLWGLAVEARDRAVIKGSYPDFQAAITSGLAAIEGLLNESAETWTRHRPKQPLVDTPQSRVSFDQKISQWLPIMARGNFDKGHRRWSDLMRLRVIRDDLTVHPKEHAFGVPYAKFAEDINRFRDGIADTLFHIHMILPRQIPPRVIRARFQPDAVVVRVPAT